MLFVQVTVAAATATLQNLLQFALIIRSVGRKKQQQRTNRECRSRLQTNLGHTKLYFVFAFPEKLTHNFPPIAETPT